MTFDYNMVLNSGIDIPTKTIEYNETEIIEKYRKGEYRIVIEQARYPLANLKEIFSAYNFTPEYQRRRVWDAKRKSRLIESFIINVPVPSIFLYEYDFSKYEVMDGLQRITSILEFFDNKYQLEGLELWSELNGKYYEDLPLEIRTAVERRYLSAVILLKETASDEQKEKMMKRFVFERLNTGGVKLSDQEIRNALYTCEFNEALVTIAESKDFRTLWGKLEDESYSRMEDCELVLRFFAYKSACKNNVAKPTAFLLDKYAEIAKQFTYHDVEVLKRLFNETLEIATKLFGNTAFKSSEKSNKSEKMIYDAIMISCAELIEEGYKERLMKLDNNKVSDEKFEVIKNNTDAFNGKYTSIKNVNERIALIRKFLTRLCDEL